MSGEPEPVTTWAVRSGPAQQGAPRPEPGERGPGCAAPCAGLARFGGAHPEGAGAGRGRRGSPGGAGAALPAGLRERSPGAARPDPMGVLPGGGLRLGKSVLQGIGGARRAAAAAVGGAPVPAAEEAQPAAGVREQRYGRGKPWFESWL